MAYAAAANLKFVVENHILYYGPCFSSHSLKLLQLASKEIKSFQEFLEGLNGSSRKRMNASLRRISEAILTFSDKLWRHLGKQFGTQRTEALNGRLLISMEVESMEEEFHAVFRKMKSMKMERFNGDAADFGGIGNKSKMVGLSDVYNKLKEDILVVQSADRIRFFSIIGMAGIGKTNLAEAIFEDLDVLEWYDCCVWVTVGKKYRLEEVVRRIMVQVNPVGARELADGEIDPEFEYIWREKRCLVVLDDVWDAQLCGQLRSFLLRDNVNGSRVILTSRSRRVAEQVELITEIRLLNEKESWILLHEKVFGENFCPPELEKIGKKIAEKCDGLPLTIITVAGLLKKMPESLWIDVATKRKHQLFIDAYDAISKVLFPSYEDIPQHLKLCFLYMAVFPPNSKISRSRLINMWLVEGLLESYGAKSFEDCVDESVEEFSSNSLVMVYQKRSRSYLPGPIEETKSCGLHSSWWHLCYMEARKNNFFYVLISREDRFGKGIDSQSRLSIQNNILFAIKDVYDSMEQNSASTACSLLCLGPYCRYPVPICFGLRLLKNLDALNIRFYEFPLEVLELGCLKYFSLTCDGELPPSISKLQNLQFFIVHRDLSIKSHGTPSYLPLEIWDMIELKHFQIMGSDLPEHHHDTILPNLSTLLDVSGDSCTKGIVDRIPFLKKLGIRIELALDATEPLCFLNHVSQLKKLEILKCIIVNPTEHKFEFVSLPNSPSILPLSLKKLTLSGLGYPWKEMSKIASLPCLEVLKLRGNAFRGPNWEVQKDAFLMLKSLVLEDIDLMQWTVGRGSFDALTFICIKHCYKLKEIHWEFDARINKVEVVDSNPSIENLIREALLRQIRIPYFFSVHSSWEEEEVKP